MYSEIEKLKNGQIIIDNNNGKWWFVRLVKLIRLLKTFLGWKHGRQNVSTKPGQFVDEMR